MSQAKKITIPIELTFQPWRGEYRLMRASSKRKSSTLYFRTQEGFSPFTVPREALDAWQVRDELILLEDGQFKEFTQKYGRFAVGGVDIRSSDADADGIQDFDEWRSLVSEALVLPMAQWHQLATRYPEFKVRRLRQMPLKVSIKVREDGVPSGRINAIMILDAVLSSIFIDQLQGARFRWCAREDCPSPPFRLTTGHDRKYCSAECAHLEAVRSYRARLKEDSPKTSITRKRGKGGKQQR